ncbi:hypothetical protein Q4595_11505 [Wenyingzhuangia sp. 1_MG-2023]|nr:hypothetical protein [Wenyingzhuangia sp. 1_MG-2023]
MGLFNKLFGNLEKAKPDIQQDEHAVIIYFNYGLDGMENLYELSNKLENIIKEKKLGEFDGHEIAVDLSDGTLYMYFSPQ